MTTNLQVAKPVIDNVNIRMVTLKTATVNSTVDPLDAGAKVEASFHFRARSTLPEKWPDNLYVHVGMRLDVRPDGEDKSAASLLELEAEYLLVYDLPAAAQYQEGALQYFAELNGTYNAWPYWRELVQTVSGRVGLASIVVPVFRPPIRNLDVESEQLSLEPIAGSESGAAPTQHKQ